MIKLIFYVWQKQNASHLQPKRCWIVYDMVLKPWLGVAWEEMEKEQTDVKLGSECSDDGTTASQNSECLLGPAQASDDRKPLNISSLRLYLSEEATVTNLCSHSSTVHKHSYSDMWGKLLFLVNLLHMDNWPWDPWHTHDQVKIHIHSRLGSLGASSSSYKKWTEECILSFKPRYLFGLASMTVHEFCFQYPDCFLNGSAPWYLIPPVIVRW